MTARVSRKSEIAIAVFYPGNSLMHQAASWASDRPGSVLEVSFADSLPEIRTALQKADVAIVDATEDPARAMDAFIPATIESELVAAAVYTETMHPGLEMFVRSRGALLLWGPMQGEPWQELFDAMTRPKDKIPDCEAPLRQWKENEVSVRETPASMRPSKDTAGDGFRRSA